MSARIPNPRSPELTAPYSRGFTSLKQEVRLDDLPVRGQIPTWLTGTLIRNGPAKFEVGSDSYMHWFDGLAMLHKFSFQHGRVNYANRFLESSNFQEATQRGRIVRQAFGTDPCRSMFRRVMAIFFPDTVDNANVSISMLANRLVALTETPLPIAFDLETLRSTGLEQVSTPVGQLTTAHPHLDFERRLSLNYYTELARRSRYHIVSSDETGHTRVIGSIPVERPAYMHTFAVSARYVILAEFPIVVNPLRLLFGTQPFIENFRWLPQRGTRFAVVNKDDGRLVATHQADAVFSFHHVNAFEHADEIVLDFSAYRDAAIIESFYLRNLRSAMDLPTPELRRYHLRHGRDDCSYEVLSQENLEFPRINYRAVNARAYRYVYGAGTRMPGNFIDQLVKVDVQDGTARTWFEEDAYPGEPVFVAAPDAAGEDKGAILSIVLDGKSGTSFLLVLDAQTFEELGRATVPHHIPFGFHGQYITGGGMWSEPHLHR